MEDNNNRKNFNNEHNHNGRNNRRQNIKRRQNRVNLKHRFFSGYWGPKHHVKSSSEMTPKQFGQFNADFDTFYKSYEMARRKMAKQKQSPNAHPHQKRWNDPHNSNHHRRHNNEKKNLPQKLTKGRGKQNSHLSKFQKRELRHLKGADKNKVHQRDTYIRDALNRYHKAEDNRDLHSPRNRALKRNNPRRYRALKNNERESTIQAGGPRWYAKGTVALARHGYRNAQRYHHGWWGRFLKMTFQITLEINEHTMHSMSLFHMSPITIYRGLARHNMKHNKILPMQKLLAKDTGKPMPMTKKQRMINKVKKTTKQVFHSTKQNAKHYKHGKGLGKDNDLEL